jgi:hypothetical protein
MVDDNSNWRTAVNPKFLKKLVAMKIILRSLILFLMLISCEESTHESISPIINTELPPTAPVGHVVSFKVYHVVYNGCGQFSRHETSQDEKTITVKFYGKYPEAKICTDEIPTLETKYDFKPTDKGEYVFRFYQDNYSGVEFLLDTLVVQ